MRIFTVLSIVVACLASGCSQTDRAPDRAAHSADSVTVTLVAEDSITVLDLLKARRAVEYRESAMGAFVTGIDSVESGGGFFWTYSINDRAVPVACDKQLVGPGDTVIWRFRSGSD